MKNDLSRLLAQAESILGRMEQLLPQPACDIDWKTSRAFRWRKRQGAGFLEPVKHPHHIGLKDLQGVDDQKREIDRNTKQFVMGLPANNCLLTGSRGTGKSSLVKAVLNKYASKGLRLIEVDKGDLADLPDIVDRIYDRPERFIIFCDDLSFESGEPGYKALKVALDGSISAASDNMLIYATSNRRHLMPEYMEENLATRHVGEEIHFAESVEEKISLSERFGLWLSFDAFNQDEYLSIVNHWVASLGLHDDDSDDRRLEALRWALLRGSRSGRVAWQFARDWAGRHLKLPSK